MEKKTTVHPIILTLEQLELVRQLVKPSIEYDDDGDMNIWAEDENAMNAAQIYRQTEIANKIELQLAWLTVYNVHRAHGGEEEGGWGYDHWDMRETKAWDMDEEDALVDREAFVHNLGVLLTQTREDVVKCELVDRGDTVVITFKGGGTRTVNVHADSYAAIIRDVMKHV